MRIDGYWLRGSDGVERPVVDEYLELANGHHVTIPLLIDTGADTTILAPTVAQQLAAVLQPTALNATAIGIGGALPMHQLAVDLLLGAPSGQRARIRGPIPVLVTPGSIEWSVVGRDVLDRFTLIYSYPHKLIALLTPPHTSTFHF